MYVYTFHCIYEGIKSKQHRRFNYLIFCTFSEAGLLTGMSESRIMDLGAVLFLCRHYYSSKHEVEINKALKQMLELGAIERSVTMYNSQSVIVNKTANTYPYCFDNRNLN